MPIPKRTIRSLQDIRTLSGSVDQLSESYRAYMKISCLEMEKARRGKEKDSAMHLIKNIEHRFKEIEKEKDLLLKSLGERNAIEKPSTVGNRPKQPSGHPQASFKIRY